MYDKLGETWYYGNTLSAVIGQAENNFTPLQMARYIAMLTNGGKQVDVTIIKDIVTNNGESVKREEVNEYVNDKNFKNKEEIVTHTIEIKKSKFIAKVYYISNSMDADKT